MQNLSEALNFLNDHAHIIYIYIYRERERERERVVPFIVMTLLQGLLDFFYNRIFSSFQSKI